MLTATEMLAICALVLTMTVSVTPTALLSGMLTADAPVVVVGKMLAMVPPET